MSSWKVTQPGTPVAKGGHNSPWRSETRTWWMSAPSSAGPAAPAQAPPWWADTWVVVYPSAAWSGVLEGGATMIGWGVDLASWGYTIQLDLMTFAMSPLIHATGPSSSYWDNVGAHRNMVSGFLTTNRESLIQIGIGTLDIALGVGLVGTAGGAPPGLLLIAVGADQVYTGIANILTGQKNRSLFEEAGYNLTLKLGFSEGTAGIVGQLTPGLLSLGAGIWGGLATSAARAGGGVAGMPRFEGWSAGTRQLLGSRYPMNAARTQQAWAYVLENTTWLQRRNFFNFGGMTYLPPVSIHLPRDFQAGRLLLNLARLTQREVGLIQLGSGRVVVRLGGETSFSLNRRFFPATQLYAHTHPNGSLWLSTARDGGRGADTAALFQLQMRNPGVNPWTIVIGNDGRAVTWFRSGNRFGPELEDYFWSFFQIR